MPRRGGRDRFTPCSESGSSDSCAEGGAVRPRAGPLPPGLVRKVASNSATASAALPAAPAESAQLDLLGLPGPIRPAQPEGIVDVDAMPALSTQPEDIAAVNVMPALPTLPAQPDDLAAAHLRPILSIPSTWSRPTPPWHEGRRGRTF